MQLAIGSKRYSISSPDQVDLTRPRFKRSKLAPDFGIQPQRRRIWVEAACLSHIHSDSAMDVRDPTSVSHPHTVYSSMCNCRPSCHRASNSETWPLLALELQRKRKKILRPTLQESATSKDGLARRINVRIRPALPSATSYLARVSSSAPVHPPPNLHHGNAHGTAEDTTTLAWVPRHAIERTTPSVRTKIVHYCPW